MKTSWYDLYFVDPQLWFFVTWFFITLVFVGLCLLEKAWVWAEKTGRLERVKAWAMRVRDGRRALRRADMDYLQAKERHDLAREQLDLHQETWDRDNEKSLVSIIDKWQARCKHLEPD